MSGQEMNRRRFLGEAVAGAGGVLAAASLLRAEEKAPPFRISLAAWSLHRMYFDGKIDLAGMVKMCRDTFDIDGFEFVNVFFPAPTYAYCNDLKKLAADKNVRLLLIMCDREGDMSHADRKERMQAARNHHKWVDIAAVLGCHAIRCNTGHGEKGDTDAVKRAAETFSALVEYGKANRIRVIIENHGGLSSDADWLVDLMKRVGEREWFGTLPDFGNFPKGVDKYESVRKMMPYAHAVSAKCHDFDDAGGTETTIDFARMMKIVTDAGYNGFVGIEYEGSRLDEAEGIKRAKTLLDKLRA